MELLEPLIDLFTVHGYLAVFVVLLVCSIGLPLPEDVTLVAGGIIAGLGYADVGLMGLVGLGGVMAGDATVFLIGHHFGVRAMRLRWVAMLLTPRRYARVQAKFHRHGNRLMFVARFLPGLRTAVFLSAGMSHRVSFLRFLLLDGLAALISVPFWVGVGYVGAENRAWLLDSVRAGQGGIALAIALLALVVGAPWLRRRWQRRARIRALRAHRRARAADLPQA